MTLDAFVRIAFGVDLGCVSSAPTEVPFMTAFDGAQALIPLRFINPFWKLCRFFGIAGEGQGSVDFKVVREFARQVISERKPSDDEPDLLSLFMEEKHRYSKEAPSTRDLTDIALNFIIAGRDTTAQTLSYVFYMLNRRPDVLKKVMEEVDRESAATWWQRCSQMKYLHAVISETLRLYPIVFGPIKVAVKDDVLPNGFKVSADTHIVAQ